MSAGALLEPVAGHVAKNAGSVATRTGADAASTKIPWTQGPNCHTAQRRAMTCGRGRSPYRCTFQHKPAEGGILEGTTYG